MARRNLMADVYNALPTELAQKALCSVFKKPRYVVVDARMVEDRPHDFVQESQSGELVRTIDACDGYFVHDDKVWHTSMSHMSSVPLYKTLRNAIATATRGPAYLRSLGTYGAFGLVCQFDLPALPVIPLDRPAPVTFAEDDDLGFASRQLDFWAARVAELEKKHKVS